MRSPSPADSVIDLSSDNESQVATESEDDRPPSPPPRRASSIPGPHKAKMIYKLPGPFSKRVVTDLAYLRRCPPEHEDDVSLKQIRFNRHCYTCKNHGDTISYGHGSRDAHLCPYEHVRLSKMQAKADAEKAIEDKVRAGMNSEHEAKLAKMEKLLALHVPSIAASISPAEINKAATRARKNKTAGDGRMQALEAENIALKEKMRRVEERRHVTPVKTPVTNLGTSGATSPKVVVIGDTPPLPRAMAELMREQLAQHDVWRRDWARSQAPNYHEVTMSSPANPHCPQEQKQKNFDVEPKHLFKTEFDPSGQIAHRNQREHVAKATAPRKAKRTYLTKAVKERMATEGITAEEAKAGPPKAPLERRAAATDFFTSPTEAPSPISTLLGHSASESGVSDDEAVGVTRKRDGTPDPSAPRKSSRKRGSH